MEVQAFADDDIKTGEEKKKKKMKDKESPAVLQVIDSNQDRNRGDNGDAELVFGDDGCIKAGEKKKKKRKKKKKDKGMEMAESVPSFFPAPVSVNKKVVVPKHVREMREILSKRKEAEERKRREEEERLRKEEEERVNQEELDRLAQEKKRLKKEKLLKKKKEGKLLTGKQKEEARRLEAMRKQILAYANLDSSTAAAAPAKRIRYQTKKPKPQAAVSDSNEIQQDVVPELDSVSVEGEGEGVESPSSHEEAVDDENWDAKSWDGVGDLKLQDFGDEEAASEPEPLPKKVAAVMPRKLESVPGPEVVVVKQDRSKPDDHGQNLRSPICCIMGHVDAGKTKLLDCIRRTNVQEGEAGGITQQIGATYFPAENIRERTKGLKADAKLNVPGLLVIDTPGHESFTNMRSRGSALCDIAVLVVDIMHGLEPQTIESLKLLKEKETDFIVALNKVDRLYGWKPCCDEPIKKAIGQQSKEVKKEFTMRITQVITQFKEQGFNTELYFKNKEMGETYNIVPTSAISGEGIPDLLLLLVKWAEKTMAKRLTCNEQVQCSVLEVKVVEGHGTTIDVVLVNGVLHEGDQIVVGSMQGSIVTKIRALLTPHPMKELRVKGTYLHHKEIKAAQGIKIAAQGLEHAIAGTSLYVVGPHDDIEGIKKAAMEEVKSVTNNKVDKSGVKSVINKFDRSGVGVYVQASTDGSLDALLKFLKTPAVNIPFSDTSIGPVHKKDVRKASAMLEKKKEYATILAFDVEVAPEVRERADELGVKIFTADIMYHLVDQFTAYIHNLKEEKKREAAEEAVFPCILQVIHVYRNKDPILLGVKVIDGIAKVGTPVCIFRREEPVDIGRIASIQVNNKDIDSAKKGQEVAIKITGSRQLQIKDKLISKISRRSLDVLKEHYRDEISSEEMLSLLFELKDKFKIQ